MENPILGTKNHPSEGKMQVEQVYADVLCVGGGIAGLMGAIRAGELGMKAVLADQSNTL